MFIDKSHNLRRAPQLLCAHLCACFVICLFDKENNWCKGLFKCFFILYCIVLLGLACPDFSQSFSSGPLPSLNKLRSRLYPFYRSPCVSCFQLPSDELPLVTLVELPSRHEEWAIHRLWFSWHSDTGHGQNTKKELTQRIPQISDCTMWCDALRNCRSEDKLF